MPPSRTPVDWLIVIVNIPAILLGLAVGWLWIIDAAQHSEAGDNRSRLGLAIGFIMAYLVWNSVVMIYLILRRPPPPTGTGEKLKIKRSTLQAALAQSRGEAPLPKPAADLVPAEPRTERITVEPPPEAIPVEPPAEPDTAEPAAYRLAPEPATEAKWDETLPPIRRQEP